MGMTAATSIDTTRAREATAGVVWADGRTARVMLRPMSAAPWSVHTVGARGEPVDARFHLAAADAFADYACRCAAGRREGISRRASKRGSATP